MHTDALNLFENRKLLIATKHGKESVIAPLLEKALGVKCIVPENYNTDIFGTFTGEIERKNDPVSTLRQKCQHAMNMFDCDLAVASEGSFGPHPSLYFANADDELLILIDRKNELEIKARELSLETNFSGSEIKSEKELREFASRALFPSHALILRNKKNSNLRIVKGINNKEALLSSYHELLQQFNTVYAETDMRAMFNPSRMKVIGKATENLISNIKTCCPQCNTPGFEITEIKTGLPCKWCGHPTQSPLYFVYTCSKCSFKKKTFFPHHKSNEDPMYCPNCNP